MKSEMIITIGEGKKVDAEFGGFVIRTDQPRQVGGEGSAPEPFALFLASIGTCAGIFVSSFCQSRGIPTDGIRLVQTHYAKPSGYGIGRIEIAIEVPPSFPDKYRDAVVNAANLCAVKRHIQDPPEFDVKTVVTA
ncbi:osmotically inducible protein C [candidate division GN15 bacterium]|uniref:Osmotically inducible protein C n=1 Tax=candidate division GN15 bacterium TaxID=2072418 RepID=A0A855X300_9BACT|nr:MAG: osmotically inducible protein C [candidate division GN15 bacterium]